VNTKHEIRTRPTQWKIIILLFGKCTILAPVGTGLARTPSIGRQRDPGTSADPRHWDPRPNTRREETAQWLDHVKHARRKLCRRDSVALVTINPPIVTAPRWGGEKS
jgi:hypothetical protein